MPSLIPFGYSTPDATSRLDALMSDEQTILIDIRYSVKSLKRPEWSGEALQARYGKRYLWLQSLGNRNYFTHGPIEIARPDIGIPRLLSGLEKGYTLILLCTCKEYAHCHRKVIVEMVQEHMPSVEVIHPDSVSPAGMVQCLSIRQPWAWMLTHPEIFSEAGIPPKTIENRDWNTQYRGPLYIHASAKFDDCFDSRGRLDHFAEHINAPMPQTKAEYATKAIVGRAELTDVVTESADHWFRGDCGFVLSGAYALDEPFPLPGRLKLFPVPACHCCERPTTLDTSVMCGEGDTGYRLCYECTK